MGKKRKPYRKPECDPKLLEPGNWEAVVKENTFFARYYHIQVIVPNDEEWKQFLSILKEMLPMSYRFVGNKGKAELLAHRMLSDFIHALPQSMPRPFRTAWYPKGVSWQHSISRTEIRNNDVLKEYHKFLLTEQDCGNLVRQELVSQIPPLLLNVEPHHYVLDMCASPGSKTSQLIDMLHEESICPSGIIVANDSSNPRCYTMTHNLKRYGSPCLIVTNHNAINMPNIDIRSENLQSSEAATALMYDRVLCDVPCTGDATLRKNYTIWTKWHSKNGNSLHRLQLAILKRGVHLLKPGGRLVYSTCSFNPVENEAVVSAALNFFGNDVLQLLEVSDQLNGLISEKGLSNWTVFSDEDRAFSSFADYKEKGASLPKNVKLQPTLFPPPAEDTERILALQKCLRILPHKQNSGGFFVAVFEKIGGKSSKRRTKPEPTAEAIAEKDEEKETDESLADLNADAFSFDSVGPPPAKQAKFKGLKEDPFVFITDFENDLCVACLKNDFGIKENFPLKNLLKRKDTEGGRKVSLTNDTVQRIVSVNDNSRLKIIHAGTLVLEKRNSDESDLGYRLVQDGIDLMVDYVSKRVIEFSRDEVTQVLMADSVPFKLFSEQTQQELEKIGNGSIVIKFTPCEDDLKERKMMSFVFCAWKGRFTVRAYIKECEKEHFLRLCGHSHAEVKAAKEKLQKSAVEKVEELSIENGKTSDSTMTESAEVADVV